MKTCVFVYFIILILTLGHVLIYDLEKYREVSENMYEVLKPQGIKTLVTGSLILNGSYIGFFGVDNPPINMMEEISEIHAGCRP